MSTPRNPPNTCENIIANLINIFESDIPVKLISLTITPRVIAGLKKVFSLEKTSCHLTKKRLVEHKSLNRGSSNSNHGQTTVLNLLFLQFCDLLFAFSSQNQFNFLRIFFLVKRRSK